MSVVGGNSLHLREDAVVGPLDDWIAGLVTPEALAQAHALDGTGAKSSALRAKLTELDRKIGSLMSALETGVSVPEITQQLQRRSKERAGLEAELRQSQAAAQVTAQEMRRALEDLGGIAEILPSADPAQRARLYASLGVRLEYDHVLKRVRATADTACVPGRVRRGT